MADQALAVQITAVDRFSAELAKFKQSLEKTGVPVDKLGKATERLKPSQGLASMGKAFGDLGTQARGAADELGRIVPPLAAITGAASLAGMAKLVGNFGDWGTRLGNQATRLGVAAGDLQAFQNAARLAGVSAGAATGGLQALTDNLRDAAGGRNPQVLGWFRALGVSMTDASGRARSASELMPQLADKIAAIKNPSDQARVAVALFGGAGEEMLPFLRRGAAGMRDLADTAKRYGVMNEAGVLAADAFRESQVRVQLAVEGLTYSVAQRLAPSLVPLLNRLADWTASQGPALAEALGRIADRFAAWVNNGGLDQLGKKIEGIGSTVNGLVQATTGWDGVAELAFGALAVKRVAGFAKAIAGVRAETALLKAGLSALAADAVLSAIDPQDKLGSWIDRNIPGAAWFDDWMARHTGAGRTYQEQREADPSSLAGYAEMNRRTGPGGGYATDENHRPVRPIEAAPGTFKPLLDLIGRSEGTDRGRGYNETLGYGKFTGGPVDLTGMTLAQIDALQTRMLANPANTLHSSAVGRYQIVQSTLRPLERQLGLDPDTTLFTPAIQDRLASALIQRRGGDDFLAGRIDASALQSGLAREWASIPDPETGASAYGQGTGASTPDVQGTLRRLTTQARYGVSPLDPASTLAPRPTRTFTSSAPAAPLPATPPSPVPLAPPVPVPSASAGTQGVPGANGKVAMHVQFSGAPAGTRMTASADGDVSLSTQGLVDQAFPLIGGP